MAFADDLIDTMETAGVGDLGVSIFASSKASIPLLASGLATVHVLVEPGASPENTQNATVTPAYLRPSAVLVTRADNWVAAEAKARAAYDALFLRNVTINGTWYREISPTNDVHDAGLDDRQQARASFSITAVKRP